MTPADHERLYGSPGCERCRTERARRSGHGYGFCVHCGPGSREDTP